MLRQVSEEELVSKIDALGDVHAQMLDSFVERASDDSCAGDHEGVSGNLIAAPRELGCVVAEEAE